MIHLISYLWVIIFSIAILFLFGTWVVIEVFGLNEVTTRKRERIFDARNEFKNKN